MPKIEIKEVYEPSPADALSSEVVYVPGVANTNANCYIFDTADGAPGTGTAGTVFKVGDTVDVCTTAGAENPSIACNIIVKTTWHYVESAWVKQDKYEAPHPENEPILCVSERDFIGNFGDKAYSDATFTDKSYTYARELAKAGLTVLYENIVTRTANKKVAPTEPTASVLADLYAKLKDKGEYTVKYLTSGVYPAFTFTHGETGYTIDKTVAEKMLKVAESRGDCVALIDHDDNIGRKLEGDGSVYGAVKAAEFSNPSFGAVFTPHASYKCGDEVVILPGSFAYLASLAKSIKNNASWLAIAGVSRGQVPNIIALNTTDKLTNAIADSYQPRDGIAINAITNIRPYGLTIWGNRTLIDNSDKGDLIALSFLNIRNLISDVKKVAFDAARKLQFEQDSNILWLNFKSAITPLLDKMQSGYGISAYKIIRETTDKKATVKATIRLYPVFAVEDFDITVIMSDDEIQVS